MDEGVEVNSILNSWVDVANLRLKVRGRSGKEAREKLPVNPVSISTGWGRGRRSGMIFVGVRGVRTVRVSITGIRMRRWVWKSSWKMQTALPGALSAMKMTKIVTPSWISTRR